MFDFSGIEWNMELISLIIVIGYTLFGWLVPLGIKLNYGRLKNSLSKIEFEPKFAWFLF